MKFAGRVVPEPDPFSPVDLALAPLTKEEIEGADWRRDEEEQRPEGWAALEQTTY